jgi:hypothetical protein
MNWCLVNIGRIALIVFVIISSIFLINLIFGYWRSNTTRFSIQWILAIHLPVPMAIGLRFWLLGWSWPLLPAFVASFAAGQFIGGKIRQNFSKQQHFGLTSFLITDLIQAVSKNAGKQK